jgi:hypothetical protein
MGDHPHRVAWVRQESCLSGDLDTFEVHIQERNPGATSPAFVWGPQGVPFERAVAWARQHTDRVVVDIGNRRFSVGDRPATGVDAEGMPAGGLEALRQLVVADVQQAPQTWRGRSGFTLTSDEFARAAPTFVDALQRDPLVRVTCARADAAQHVVEAELLVEAVDESHALQRARGAVRRAVTAQGGLVELLDPDRTRTTVSPEP